MTVPISSSVAEKAECWCDGRRKRKKRVRPGLPGAGDVSTEFAIKPRFYTECVPGPVTEVVPRSVSLFLSLVNHAALHHEVHMLECAYVRHRVGVHRDHVGILSDFNRAYVGRPSDQIRRTRSCRADRLRRRQPEFHHVIELFRIVAVRIYAGIGAEGHFIPRLPRPLETL